MLLLLLIKKMYLSIVFIVCSTILLHEVKASSMSSLSYQLSYDGIISPKKLENQDNSSPLSSNKMAHSIIIDMAEKLSDGYLTKIQQLDVTCVPKKIFDSSKEHDYVIIGTKCNGDYRSKDLTFEATVSIEKVDYDDINSINNNNNNTATTIRIDTIVGKTIGNDDVKELFIKIVPVIDARISDIDSADDRENSISLWNIRERNMPLLLPNQRVNPTNATEVSPKHDDIEQRILANEGIRNKKLLYSSQINYVSDQSSTLNIWEYKSIESEKVHRDIYVGSKLRGSTSETALAHAEAFVHPSLIASPNPKRVAVISDMPGAYVKEILKYKSVENITIVGSTRDVIDTVSLYLHHMNDCTTIDNVSDYCLDDLRLEVVDDDVLSWSKRMLDACQGIDLDVQCELTKDNEYENCAPYPAFDVVLVDVASDYFRKNLLSVEFFEMILGFTTSDSVIVFNSESTPSIDNGHGFAETEIFIASAIEYCNEADIWLPFTVYDESTAAPQNTAFLIIHRMLYSYTYHRFVRDNQNAFDLDMMERMQSLSLPPTKYYDGMTHLSYLRPSRLWENWYCQSILGKYSLQCSNLIRDWYDENKHGYKTEVRRDPVKGRALHAAEDIPQGSFILAEDTYLQIHLDSYQWEALNSFVNDFPDALMYKELRDFIVTYGFQMEPPGSSGWSVSLATNNTFTNHGCSTEEWNVKGFPYTLDPKVLDKEDKMFSIFSWRRPFLAMATGAIRDIKKGEAITMDYSNFRTYEDPSYTNFLQGICSYGKGLVNAEDGSKVNLESIESLA